MKILSILICTMPSRQHVFDLLLTNLQNQINQNNLNNIVEIITDDSMSITTGAKRNLLLEKSAGKFVVFIDDDDAVTDDYVQLISQCIEQNPTIDCIGISGVISFSGQDTTPWKISKEYGRWYETSLGYFRTPNHISPIRRSLAIQVGFPNLTFGEDAVFSNNILPLLQSEAKIEKEIYHYQSREKKEHSPISSDGGIYRRAWR